LHDVNIPGNILSNSTIMSNANNNAVLIPANKNRRTCATRYSRNVLDSSDNLTEDFIYPNQSEVTDIPPGSRSEFQCYICGKEFSKRFNLNRHIGTHEKPSIREVSVNTDEDTILPTSDLTRITPRYYDIGTQSDLTRITPRYYDTGTQSDLTRIIPTYSDTATQYQESDNIQMVNTGVNLIIT